MRFVIPLLCCTLVACASEDQQATEDSTDTTTAAAQENAADTTHVDATLTEWAIQLSRATVPAGPVHFQIRNSGRHIHAFEVEGEGIEEEIETIQAGADAMLVVDLKPGSYEVYCPRDDDAGNHKDKGMTTLLTVQ